MRVCNLPAPALKKGMMIYSLLEELLYLGVPERLGKNFCRVFRF
jgi:hypothetical protein